MMSLDVTRDDEAPSRYGQPIAETPGSLPVMHQNTSSSFQTSKS